MRFQFSIREVFAATTTIAVCLAAMRASPRFAMLLMLLLAAGFVPAVMHVRAAAIGEPLSGDRTRLGTYDLANAFAVDATAVIVGMLAWGTTALVAFLASSGSGGARLFDLDRQAVDLTGMLFFCGSPAIGLVAAWLVYWRAWRQRIA